MALKHNRSRLLNRSKNKLGLGNQAVKKERIFALVAAAMGRAIPSSKGSGYELLAEFCGKQSRPTPKRANARRPGGAVDAFLQSYEWRRLRMLVIKERGARCECCGASPKDGKTVINVDHIKPRRFFPQLALDKSNLQVLCGACNHGKGNWDQTDWRGEASVDLRTAPTCRRCGKTPTQAMWRTYKNGDVHLVYWCCDFQVGGFCIPPEMAESFGLPNRATVLARAAIEAVPVLDMQESVN